MAGAVGVLRQLGGKTSYGFVGSLFAGSSTPTCHQVLCMSGVRGMRPSTSIFATDASRGVHATEAASAVAAEPGAINIESSRKLKRPPTAYSFFFRDHFEEYKAKHSDASFADVSRGISSQWKAMSDSEKKKFVSAADKAARSFVPPASTPGKKRGTKKEGEEKRPVPAYARFIKENYAIAKGRYPDQTSQQIFAQLAKEYRALSPEQKAKFKP